MKITRRKIFASTATGSNHMTIEVESSNAGDGFKVVIDDADGNQLYSEAYTYGYNASYNEDHARRAHKDVEDEKKYGWAPSSYRREKPYVNDIIRDLCAEYNIPQSEIEVIAGKNSFTGNKVDQSTIDEFIKDHIEACNDVMAATDSNSNYDVFMLMDYDSGDAGMESDSFYCYGKFFARNLQDAKQQLADCAKNYPNINTSDMYVSEYNEYFDNFDPSDPFDVVSNEVFSDLDTLFNYIFDVDYDEDNDPDFPGFIPASTDIMTSETIDIEDNKEYIKATGSSLRDEVYAKAIEVMMSPDFGFDEDEAKAYTFVETYPSDDGDATVVELRAEVSYDGMMELAAACTSIVAKYDEDAYFDMAEPGIAVAYIENQYIESASYGGAYDIEDDMFFNKDEIVEWAEQVVDVFNSNNNSDFHVADVYFKDSANLVLEIENADTIFNVSSKIDMRRIGKPSDISKYVDEAVSKLQAEYDAFYNDIEAATDAPEENIDDIDITDDADDVVEDDGDRP